MSFLKFAYIYAFYTIAKKLFEDSHLSLKKVILLKLPLSYELTSCFDFFTPTFCMISFFKGLYAVNMKGFLPNLY